MENEDASLGRLFWAAFRFIFGAAAVGIAAVAFLAD
jgi:hypothetical protein